MAFYAFFISWWAIVSRFVVRRLILFLPSLLGTTILVFALVRVLPGDVVDVLLAQSSDHKAADALRHQFGLNQPIAVQYLRWLGHVLSGDLGTSLYSQASVAGRLGKALPVTVELAILSFTISTVIGIFVGTVSAVYQDRWTDYVLRSISIIGLSIPSFWLGTLLLVVPAIALGYSAPLRYREIWQDPGANLQQVIFPSVALGLALSSIIACMTRSVVLEVLREDYVRTAYAKGLVVRKAVVRHVLPNSLIPIVTLLGSQLGFLLGGTVLMESIFTLPGLGSSTLDAMAVRDYPIMQANVLVFAVMLMIVNLGVDLLYARLDPRIHYQ